jgi:hypothetical protein
MSIPLLTFALLNVFLSSGPLKIVDRPALAPV